MGEVMSSRTARSTRVASSQRPAPPKLTEALTKVTSEGATPRDIRSSQGR